MPNDADRNRRDVPASVAVLLFMGLQWFYVPAMANGGVNNSGDVNDSDAVTGDAAILPLAPETNTSSDDKTKGDTKTDAAQSASQSETPSASENELIINPSQARPNLDYVPSETISEDKSVSFPVDI